MPNANQGYDKTFTGLTLNLPSIPASLCAPLKNDKGIEIRYTHYSSFQHKDRKLPLLCASNIKGEGYNAPNRAGNEPCDWSDQVINACQLNNDFYGNDGNTFDRGHIVRRVDTCWGDDDVAEKAEAETFRWSNCSPQHKKLNQKGGAWFQLEQHVMENGVKNKLADICVFAGPVLSKDDKYMEVKKGALKGQYIQIPTEFWKVIVWKKSDGKLYGVGFLMNQWEFIKEKVTDIPAVVAVKKKEVIKDDYFENLKFADNKTYQVPISVIAKKTEIKFDWKNVQFPYKPKKAKVVKATPLRKKYAFSSLYLGLKLLKAESGSRPAVGSTLRKAAILPLSENRIAKAKKAKYTGALRQYTLSNITL